MKRDKKRHNKKDPISYYGFFGDDVHVAGEKNKARELRNSPWWRKKTSSGICHYCGKKFFPSELTMDHKIPLSRGGNSDKENIVPACKDCNNKKKYLLPAEWAEYIDKIKGEGNG